MKSEMRTSVVLLVLVVGLVVGCNRRVEVDPSNGCDCIAYWSFDTEWVELRNERYRSRFGDGNPYSHVDAMMARWVDAPTPATRDDIEAAAVLLGGAPLAYLIEKIVATGDATLIGVLKKIERHTSTPWIARRARRAIETLTR
jgi:hypothetical protein